MIKVIQWPGYNKQSSNKYDDDIAIVEVEVLIFQPLSINLITELSSIIYHIDCCERLSLRSKWRGYYDVGNIK